MTDPHDIARKLLALATNDTAFVDGARVICRDGMPAPLTALLAEIDTHVLERQLAFNVDGNTLQVVVAGRRLRGLLASPGVPETVTGTVLSKDDAETLDAAGAFLQRFCQNARLITVRSAGAAPFGTPSELGIPASALTKLWDPAEPANAGSPMEQFLTAQVEAVTDFLLVTEGQITATKGDASALEPIWRNQALALDTQQATIFPRQKTPTLICLDPRPDGSRAPALASLGTETAVFFYDPAKIGRILMSWQMITN